MKTNNRSHLGGVMKSLTLIALTILVGIVASLPAHAACTLNADPSQNLTGTWAFQVTGVLTSDVLTKIITLNFNRISFGAGFTEIPGGGAIAGTFTVVTGPPAPGRNGGPVGGGLSVLASTNLSNTSTGGLYGESAYQGTFSVDGTCDHGTLQFSSGSPNLSSPYDYYFTNLAKTEMFLIGMQSENVFSGIAKKLI
jgi:hypothetical protein